MQSTDNSLNPDLLDAIRTAFHQPFAQAGQTVPPENIRQLRQRTRTVTYPDAPVAVESVILVFIDPVLSDGKLKINPHVGLVKAAQLGADAPWVINHFTIQSARGLAVARAGLLVPDRVLAYGVYSTLPGARRAVLKIADAEVDSDDFTDGSAIVLATLAPTTTRAEVWLLDDTGKDFARYVVPTK